METIIYQGQEVAVQLVHYIHGDAITTGGAGGLEFNGEEELLRDQAGRYYLRQTWTWVGHGECAETKASGRTRVHRINLNAAILWAITRLNNVTFDLRADAANLLTEGRGYTDPTPTPPMRRAVELAAKANASVTFNSEEDTVTVPLTLPRDLYRSILAMGEHDGRSSLSETVQCSMDGEVIAWLQGPDKPAPANFLKRWLVEHPWVPVSRPDEIYSFTDLLTVRDERIMATLDAHVTRLLRAYAGENPKEDPRDTINGMLACLLQCELGDDNVDSSKTTKEARKRRLAREKTVKKMEAAR